MTDIDEEELDEVGDIMEEDMAESPVQEEVDSIEGFEPES